MPLRTNLIHVREFIQQASLRSAQAVTSCRALGGARIRPIELQRIVVPRMRRPVVNYSDDRQHADGSQDPLILRGLIQFIVVCSFFTLRYLLDVIFTPTVVDALARDICSCVMSTARAARSLLSIYLLPIAALRAWQRCDSDAMTRSLLFLFALRMLVNIVGNNALVVGTLTKRDVWCKLVPFTRFVRVSGGRVLKERAPIAWQPWFRGPRRLACVLVPWTIRAALLHWLTSVVFQSPASNAAPAIACGVDDHRALTGGTAQGGVYAEEHALCSTFTGQPLLCLELRRAREFNQHIMPSLQHSSYRQVRTEMTKYGLFGSGWHVGHACPDPSKTSVGDSEDRGWNLFAQHATDNVRLGHCVVSCSEASYMAATHVPCDRSKKCVAKCGEQHLREASHSH